MEQQIAVAELGVCGDGVTKQLDKRALGRVDALREALSPEDSEKALDQIGPRRMRRRVVKVHARVPLEPVLGDRVLVNAQIVEDDLKIASGKARRLRHS